MCFCRKSIIDQINKGKFIVGCQILKYLMYVTCDPTVQTRLVPIQVHLWNLRRRFPVDILKYVPSLNLDSLASLATNIHLEAQTHY